jgi:hypothetical protein
VTSGRHLVPSLAEALAQFGGELAVTAALSPLGDAEQLGDDGSGAVPFIR